MQINRVFIYNDSAELERLRPVMQAQQEMGISVRAISLEGSRKSACWSKTSDALARTISPSWMAHTSLR